MTEADKIYQGLLSTIMEEGDEVNTRNSLTTSHFDLPNSRFTEFPLVTLKKTAVKNSLMEMEYFLRGKTHLDDLDIRVHHWWNVSCTITPNKMHYSYGHAFRKLYCPSTKIVKIPKRDYIDTFTPYKQELIYLSSIEGNKGQLTGLTFNTNDGKDKFIVLDVCGIRNTNKIYNIQFLSNGFTTSYRSDVIKEGRVKNPYSPTVYDVGYFGEPIDHPKKREVQQLWFHMMGRCYNTKDSNYSYYGGKGITVCRRWHNFAIFLNDISKLDGYEQWMLDTTGYAIDKDHYGASIYSPDTCIFLPRHINTKYAKSKGKYILSKYDEVHEFLNEVDVARFLGISRTAVVNQSRVFNSTEYVLTVVPNTEEFNYRYELLVDQLHYALTALQNNPNSRRNIITTWIPEHVQSGLMNPTNCHNTMTQFFVRNNKLHMKTYQRSADMLLGVPHNWVQSWAMLLYFAYHSGLEVGSMIWMWGDAHIYKEETHAKAISEMLRDDLFCAEKPKIDLVYLPESIEYDAAGVPVFKASDFQVIGEVPKPVVTHKINMI